MFRRGKPRDINSISALGWLPSGVAVTVDVGDQRMIVK